MVNIVILGFGNVGQHLYKAFKKAKKVVVVQVYSPSVEAKTKHKTQFINDLSQITQADIYLIAIKDDAIHELSEKLPIQDGLVVHTSGSMPLEALSTKNRRGVFYPLQTFTSHTSLEFKKIPICIEAENPKDTKLLKKLARSISKKAVPLSSEKRQKLHLGAVWVNNFSNHLFHLAEDFLRENDLDFDLLMPLISETVKKLEKMGPMEAQTGPARRNDHTSIQQHLALLKNPIHQEIYTLLTKSIQEKFHQKP